MPRFFKLLQMHQERFQGDLQAYAALFFRRARGSSSLISHFSFVIDFFRTQLQDQDIWSAKTPLEHAEDLFANVTSDLLKNFPPTRFSSSIYPLSFESF